MTRSPQLLSAGLTRWLHGTRHGGGAVSVGHRSAASMSPRAATFESLPVLEYGAMLHDFDRFVRDLEGACREVGFFVLAGLPPQTVAANGRVLSVARGFFDLPLEQKQLVDYMHSPHFRGYMRRGVESTGGRTDEREQIEFCPEEQARVISQTLPVFERLRGPNQWPEQPQEFRSAVEEWLSTMEGLSRKLTQAIAASLGLERHALCNIFEQPFIQARLVHYPAGTAMQVAETLQGITEPGGVSGVGAHSDSGFLTLLLQDDVGGLEVLNGAGKWVPATPLEGSLVCNLGEMLQLLSGGAYLSTVHHVLRPPARSGGRLSAPFFWNPALDTVIHPLVGAVGIHGQSASLEAAATAGDGRSDHPLNKLLPSYGMNALKSMARSHPAAFAKHYPDFQCLADGRVVPREL